MHGVRYGGPWVTLRSPTSISLSFASAFILSECAAVAPSVRWPYRVNLLDLSEIMLLRDAKKATSLGGVPGLVAVF